MMSLPPRFALGLLLLLSACTYGPEEDDARIEQVLRLGDSTEGVAVVWHQVFRPPTGISTFPDGGRPKILGQRAMLFRLDVSTRTATRILTQEAPDEHGQAFDLRVVGLTSPDTLYLSLTGTSPVEGHDLGAPARRSFVRMAPDGILEPVDAVPDDASLPGRMMARAPGEKNYVRFSTRRDTIVVKTEDDGPYRAMFLMNSKGVLQPLAP